MHLLRPWSRRGAAAPLAMEQKRAEDGGQGGRRGVAQGGGARWSWGRRRPPWRGVAQWGGEEELGKRGRTGEEGT